MEIRFARQNARLHPSPKESALLPGLDAASRAEQRVRYQEWASKETRNVEPCKPGIEQSSCACSLLETLQICEQR